MAVLDKRAKQNIKTSKQFLFILVYAFVLVVLPFTSCNIIAKNDGTTPEPRKQVDLEEDSALANEENDVSADEDLPYLKIKSDTTFLSDIDDIPLPPGFTTNGNKTTIYYTPSGRIVEAYADGEGKSNDVTSFYEKTLPQLGWQKDFGFRSGGVDMKFNKEGEALRLNIQQDVLEMKMNKSEEYNDEYKLRLHDDTARMTIRFSLYPNE